MRINNISQNFYTFKAVSKQNISKDKDTSNDNPISKTGEKAVLAKTTFIAGLAFGGRLLFELVDGGFAFEKLSEKADNITSKQKGLSKNAREIKKTGIMFGLAALFVAGAAALYTIFKIPEINYKGNVNAFKNKKDMDIYIKGNNVEKELYTQMNNKAKNANEEEKKKLRNQYIQLKAAKNQIPDFINKKQQ